MNTPENLDNQFNKVVFTDLVYEIGPQDVLEWFSQAAISRTEGHRGVVGYPIADGDVDVFRSIEIGDDVKFQTARGEHFSIPFGAAKEIVDGLVAKQLAREVQA